MRTDPFSRDAQRSAGRRGALRCASRLNSPLRELEALAGTLAAVLLALLHTAIAGQEAGVAQALRQVRLGTRGHLTVRPDRGGRLGGFRRQAEHILEGTGHALADRAG